MRRLIPAVALVALLAACGGGGEEEGLRLAAEACEKALAEQSDDQTALKVREESAEVAAQAAEADDRWKPLATAVSDAFVGTRELVDATSNVGSLDEIQLQQLGESTADDVRALEAECRQVRAAGGEFDGL